MATIAANGGKPLARIGILSIGDMGLGIAKLLVAHGFSVATNTQGRSQDTIDRAKTAKVDIVPTDVALVDECDVVLSIVPPKDAEQTAQRIIDALSIGGAKRPAEKPLYFADLNAVAPATIKQIAQSFDKAHVAARFIDGSILGGPPAPPKDGAAADGAEATGAAAAAAWYRPLIPTSGPHKLADLPGFGEALASTLAVKHISDGVGAASGLKMCFASLSKGYTAIEIQAFTTAYRMGVLDDLRWALGALGPDKLVRAERDLPSMAPKAYRWVREMEEISRTHSEEGGLSPAIFAGAASVFKTVADDTVLGQEKIGQRKRGRTAEDVVAAITEGLERKRKKTE